MIKIEGLSAYLYTGCVRWIEEQRERDKQRAAGKAWVSAAAASSGSRYPPKVSTASSSSMASKAPMAASPPEANPPKVSMASSPSMASKAPMAARPLGLNPAAWKSPLERDPIAWKAHVAAQKRKLAEAGLACPRG